jgi:murein L,D-transpeptidase YcbB/YkuD
MSRHETIMTPVLRAAVFSCLTAAAALSLGPTASANDTSDGMSWVRWPGQTYASNTQPTYDRNAVRAWESQPPRGFPTLGADNLTAMRKAIQRYQDIVAGGGFPAVPEGQGTMSVGLFGGAVAIVKERLALSGDLREADNDGSANFDYALEKAVKRFQASNGLTPTGIVDKRTVAAMNVPAAARLKQLQTNFQRISELNRGLPQRYILVNIPAAQIEAIEGDEVASRHSGVVGKLYRQTPVLRSSVHQLNFNPVWHLPPTVINKDLIPKGIEAERRGQDILAKLGIEAYGSDGRKVDSTRVRWTAAAGYSFKQQPGPENPLGFVKLNFPNSHSTYMHATSSETLFGRNFRAASSGCVRIAGIETLVAWILRDQGGWDLQRVLRMKETGERLDVSLRRPMPVYWAYITAWATPDGVIQFRRDLYEKDGVGTVAAAY